ncbi:MAG: outer membrane lipoprotein LolB [Gammaproteobacteria bacterium]|nr:outer membrane lipoprotein LolB [Gammaproteobacteria bacterium]
MGRPQGSDALGRPGHAFGLPIGRLGDSDISRRRSLLAAVVGGLLLAGCASLPMATVPRPVASPLDWPQRRALLQDESRFDLKGRIAVAAGEEGFTAGLRWQQRDADALIELDGPLGIGGLRLHARGEALELTTARGERLDGEAARAELERRLGFELPLAALRYWVRGVPDPADPAVEQLAEQAPRLAGLEQAGWRIEYAAYVEVPSVGELPRRLSASRDSTRLRLVVEQWRSGETR